MSKYQEPIHTHTRMPRLGRNFEAAFLSLQHSLAH